MSRRGKHFLAILAVAFGIFSPAARAHLVGDAEHDRVARLFAREFPGMRIVSQAAAKSSGAAGVRGTPAPEEAALFAPFAPAVRVRSDEQFLYVESNGLPAHTMMVGITAWQQQVPLPQPYAGANAWRIPLHPQPSPNPVSIKDRFLRGAIALAANGIPIFNPQNNRGEISAEIGELDQWGGHCGRADDYHYHAAPLHLQALLGPRLPVAVALDGYAIYGLAEPDGSAPQGLDAFNGHQTAALGYHYHASFKYPYVNGGFHGVVVERGDQVDPQPRARPVREAGAPLRGARITEFRETSPQHYELVYTMNGREAEIRYGVEADGSFPFEFSENGSVRREVYRPRGEADGAARKGKKAREE
jgi:hypothetical protein